MLNHARTLLLNTEGNQPTVPGDELIPPEFAPVALPTPLQQVRQRLFGVAPDRTMLNYRAFELLTLLHATELEEYVFALDPRITYDFRQNPFVSEDLYRPQIRPVFAGDNAQLSVIGQGGSPDLSGRMAFSAIVEAVDGELQIRFQSESRFTAGAITLSNGLSQPFLLGDTGYSLKVNSTTTANRWAVSGMLKPARDTGQLASQLESVGEPVSLRLFGTSSAEPYATFRNLWRKHGELPYRLGGLLLALIYRTEELRRGQG